MSGEEKQALPDISTGDMLYPNPLAVETDVAGFAREGEVTVSFSGGKMRLQNARDPSAGQAANYLFWCPAVFPADLAASWRFRSGKATE